VSTFRWTGRAFGIIAALLLSSSALHAADPLDPSARLVRLERWIKASLTHHPGARDDASNEVRLWSNTELKVLRADVQVLLLVLRRPDLRVNARPSSDRSIPPYTAWQVRRLTELAADYRQRNANDDIVVRGAVLHGDIAMSDPPPPLAPADGAGEPGHIKVLIGDGESLGFNREPIHWEMARALFDLVKGTPPAADVARRWYVATSMWMQHLQQHDTIHLRHGREMFPDDISLQFLSGSQQETYASAEIQAAAKSAVLPQGFFVDVPSESAALRNAETFFRRVLVIDPHHPETQLHLGHVLLARGKPQEAADELRGLTFGDDERDRRYFTALFLGAAEEGAGHFDQAREAYAQASTIVPGAQSPYVALSALATRRGNRAEALREMQRVFDLPDPMQLPTDPWWTYRLDHTRDVDTLLDALNESVGDARK
jgi:tetratricopeptide (TPR) repeat protein